MPRRNSMGTYTWTIFLLFLGLSWGQNKNYFQWSPVKISRQTTLSPYKDDASTSSYESRYYDNSAPYLGTTGYYQDSSVPYVNDGPYSADSYSADYPKSQPYHQYPEDSASYENYGYPRDENFNVTIEKYGGFGGTGDTRGYGAYDYPKKVQEVVPQDLHHDTKIPTDFPDLLRLGRSEVFRRRKPMHIHPLPPPL